MDVARGMESQGYQVVRGVIDAQTIQEVGGFLQEQSDRVMRDLNRALGVERTSDAVEAIDRIYADDRLGEFSPELKMTMSGHFPLETRLSQRLWDIPKHPRVRAVLESLFNSQTLFMHMPPTARFVLPNNKHAGVPAHQDISYNKHMKTFVTMWVPFVEIDDECGGVAMFEGSGSEPERLENREQKFWLNAVDATGFPRVHCKMSPGDILLLNPWIIHESVPNRSQRTRFSIDFRFMPDGQSSEKHVLDMQKWVVNPPAPNSIRAA